MNLIDIINKLSSARMEYQTSNNSVLNKFVVPYFIDKCDLRNLSHSIALVGSRGSGKSTYIHHFSHSTRFDQELVSVEETEFECLILCWKPDIAYCQGLKVNWLGDDAIHFFLMHTSLSLLGELSNLICNVNYHFPDLFQTLDERGNFWRALSKVTETSINSLDSFSLWLMDYKYEISRRINPVNLDGMLSIEPQKMMDYLVGALRLDYKLFSNSVFKIFVDEFELLTEEQQKIINTYRKESHKLLNWNVAYKFNARPTKETTSDQWLQSPDDYREENLDNYIKADYKIFSAEIFILTLQNAGLNCHLKVSA